MKKFLKNANNILLLVSFCSILTFLGISNNSSTFKYVSVILQTIILTSAYIIINTHRKDINWNKALPLLLPIFLYPLIRITISVVFNPQLKTLTDGFFIYGNYYELGFVGLALAVLTREKDIIQILYNYSLFSLPLGFLLMLLSMYSKIQMDTIFVGHLALNNYFIPAATLSLFSLSNKTFFIGWASIILILFMSSIIWSRSYTLIGVYFIILSITVSFKTKRKNLSLIIIFGLIILYFLGGFSFLNEKSSVQGASIIEKYKFDTLQEAVLLFLSDFNFKYILDWEGNSRTQVIIDAFKDFTLVEWFFGKGIFGKYLSIYERHTIEIGWAQELFRWGISYVMVFFFLLLKIRRNLLNKKNISPVNYIFASIILIKIMDSFIFGLPTNSVYSLLVFWGLFKLSIFSKKKNILYYKFKNHQLN